MRQLFPDPPRSRRAFPRRALGASYIRTPTSSLDWMGANWESPTSLDFEKATMTARRFAANLEIGREIPIHPSSLMKRLVAMWERQRHYIVSEGYAVDRDETLGLMFDYNFAIDATIFRTEAKCWPAIEGVTTNKTDTTL